MLLINSIHKKGRETSPFIGESLARMGNGPLRKNLDMPNELAIKLRTKLIIGRAWLKLLKYGIVYPAEFCG